MSFGEKLYTLRKNKGYSQDALAEKLAVSRQAVSKWELDETLPDYENVIKIAKMFSVSTDYLLKNDEDDKIRRIIIIPQFADSCATVDFIGTVSTFSVSILAFLYYGLRLLFTMRNPIYLDDIWYETIDEIIILIFLFIVIAISAIVAAKIYYRYKQEQK